MNYFIINGFIYKTYYPQLQEITFKKMSYNKIKAFLIKFHSEFELFDYYCEKRPENISRDDFIKSLIFYNFILADRTMTHLTAEKIHCLLVNALNPMMISFVNEINNGKMIRNNYFFAFEETPVVVNYIDHLLAYLKNQKIVNANIKTSDILERNKEITLDDNGNETIKSTLLGIKPKYSYKPITFKQAMDLLDKKEKNDSPTHGKISTQAIQSPLLNEGIRESNNEPDEIATINRILELINIIRNLEKNPLNQRLLKSHLADDTL